jgi:hypothetical protein
VTSNKPTKYAYITILDTGNLPARIALSVADRMISTASSLQEAKDIINRLRDDFAGTALHGYRVMVYQSPDGAYDSANQAFVAAGLSLEHDHGLLARQEEEEEDDDDDDAGTSEIPDIPMADGPPIPGPPPGDKLVVGLDSGYDAPQVIATRKVNGIYYIMMRKSKAPLARAVLVYAGRDPADAIGIRDALLRVWK